MSRHLIRSERLKIAMFLVSLIFAYDVKAKDFGIVGETFIVAEKDMLNVIQQKLLSMKQNGKLYHLQKAMKDKLVKKTFMSNSHVHKATQYRRWEYNPTYKVTKAIFDDKGSLLYPVGAEVNPLVRFFVPLKVFFIDGEDKDQVRWAVKHYDKKSTKIVLVRGNPFKLMHEENVRFFFDQNSALALKLGISSFPASATIENGKVIMEEVVLS